MREAQAGREEEAEQRQRQEQAGAAEAERIQPMSGRRTVTHIWINRPTLETAAQQNN